MDTTSYRQSLGHAIRREHGAQKLTQRSLSAMVGTSKSQLWRIENGKMGTSIDTLIRIADALGVKVRELVGF